MRVKTTESLEFRKESCPPSGWGWQPGLEAERELPTPIEPISKCPGQRPCIWGKHCTSASHTKTLLLSRWHTRKQKEEETLSFEEQSQLQTERADLATVLTPQSPSPELHKTGQGWETLRVLSLEVIPSREQKVNFSWMSFKTNKQTKNSIQ